MYTKKINAKFRSSSVAQQQSSYVVGSSQQQQQQQPGYVVSDTNQNSWSNGKSSDNYEEGWYQDEYGEWLNEFDWHQDENGEWYYEDSYDYEADGWKQVGIVFEQCTYLQGEV